MCFCLIAPTTHTGTVSCLCSLKHMSLVSLLLYFFYLISLLTRLQELLFSWIIVNGLISVSAAII